MNIQRFSLRALMIAGLLATSLIGLGGGGNVSAACSYGPPTYDDGCDPDLELVVVANSAANVCTADVNPNLQGTQANWDGTNGWTLAGPPVTGQSPLIHFGYFTVDVFSSGSPDTGRKCTFDYTATDLSMTVGTTTHVLLPAASIYGSLQAESGYVSVNSAPAVTTPSLGLGETTYSVYGALNPAGLNDSAPAGNYESTVTVSITPSTTI